MVCSGSFRGRSKGVKLSEVTKDRISVGVRKAHEVYRLKQQTEKERV